MGNIVNTIKKFSGNNADNVPVERCSCLPSRIPRLDKCTCDKNGSSVTGKSASAINGSINRHGTFYKEVGNEEMHLATDHTSKSGCRGDTSHCINKERQTQKETICTDSRRNGDATDSKNVVVICNQISGHMSYELDNESNRTPGSLAALVSEVLVSKVSLEKRCMNHEEAGDLESTPARNTRGRKRSRQHRACAANSLFDREDCADLIDSAPNLDCSCTPNALVHDEKVQNEDKTPCASLDVRGCESTPKASLKRRVNKKKPKHEASHQTTALNANTGVPCASFDVRGCESTPNASLKRRLNRKRTKHEASHQTMAFNANSGALVAVQPRLTRTKDLSLATPESLKRSTKSGRLIVPRLDPGSQNIVYGMGLIRSLLLRGGKDLDVRPGRLLLF
uniref:Uncharacterized protein n=1 Tax=Leersia perrieri TaxID=77586 RepID=A0A0D9W3L8_9ORYZ